MAAYRKKSRKQIEEFARQTLKDHGLNSIPIDPVELANKIGISVNHATFTEDGISGLIAKRDNNTMILVNSNDSPYRKRFTIAHEVGHFLLHLTGTDGEVVDYEADLFRLHDSEENVSTERLKEIEANQFAAALIMPAEHVMEKWEKTRSVEDLARMFNVSTEAMGYRIATLGL